ncbi:hypothetical protein ACFQ68_08470 [Amycolatopsis japonica]|uniref:hypothetical protein n=1 Tax=Amycolatopsis japonica TaxID=208439 RepID=UPI00366A82B3
MEFVMSHENSNPRTTSTTDDDRHLHVVADAPGQQNVPTTENKVRDALTGNPGATTAALATAAGVGRSTAAKILARWGRDGTAIRTAGDGPRNPDTWVLAPSDHDTDALATEDTGPDTTASDTATANEPSSDAAITPAVQEAAAGPAADDAPEATATDTDDGAPSAAESPADTHTAAKDKDRLPKGGLRALVEDYLTEHPGESFGPAKIGKDLGRSGGAVNNALEKLVADRYAIKTCEAPKRFAINPDKTDVSPTSGNTEPALDA